MNVFICRTSEEYPNHVKVTPELLDNAVCNGESPSIVIHQDVAHSFSDKELSDFLDSVCKKVSIDGEIVVCGYEIQEIAARIFTKEISLQDANILLYSGKRCALSMSMIQSYFESVGFSITRTKFDDSKFLFLVKAKRIN